MPEAARYVIDFLLSTGAASLVAGLVVWVSREWLSEKIRTQIRSEYELRLEAHKAQLKGEYDEKLETHKAQLKAQGDIEIEKLKSELSIAAAQRQAMFSRLHDRRANVIAEVYAAVKEAVSSLLEYTKALTLAGDKPREERKQIAVQKINAFSLLYNEKKIFIPIGAADKLDAIFDTLKETFWLFSSGVETNHQSGSERVKIWTEIGNKANYLSNKAVTELERDFRVLLGDMVDEEQRKK
jgi:hypothetical protein